MAYFALDIGHYLSPEALCEYRDQLEAWVEGYGAVAPIGYVIVYILVFAFSLPGGAVMTIAGGFLFGVAFGAVLTVIGATIGATALFLIARFALADYLRAKAGPALRQMEDGFNEDAFNYLLVLRLLPLFPFWLVNLVPALLGVSLGVYVLATAIGIIPATIVYTMVGDGVGAMVETCETLDIDGLFEPRILLPLAGLAVLALAPVLYKKWKAHKA